MVCNDLVAPVLLCYLPELEELVTSLTAEAFNLLSFSNKSSVTLLVLDTLKASHELFASPFRFVRALAIS